MWTSAQTLAVTTRETLFRLGDIINPHSLKSLQSAHSQLIIEKMLCCLAIYCPLAFSLHIPLHLVSMWAHHELTSKGNKQFTVNCHDRKCNNLLDTKSGQKSGSVNYFSWKQLCLIIEITYYIAMSGHHYILYNNTQQYMQYVSSIGRSRGCPRSISASNKNSSGSSCSAGFI